MACTATRPGPFNDFIKAAPSSSPIPLSPSEKKIKWTDAKPFEYIFADTWGPCKPPGYDEAIFIHGCKCPNNKKAVAFSSSTKGGQHLHLQEVLDEVHAQGHRPRNITFRTDNAHEFASDEMKLLFGKYAIKHRPGPPYMHEFQSQIEVLWRDMAKVMTTIMKTYGAPLVVWPLAALHAVNTIMNAIEMDTPHYRYTDEHYDYTKLRPFWSECYVWQDLAQRAKDGEIIEASAKLIDKAKKYRYVGALPNGNYLCFDTAKAKLNKLSKPTFLPDYDTVARNLANTDRALVDYSHDTPFTRRLYLVRKPANLEHPTILDIAASNHGTETHAYVQVKCQHDHPPIWTSLKHYLAMREVHYTELQRFLRHRHKHGGTNAFYPCFAQCSAKPIDRAKFHPAVVVSVDTDLDVKQRFQVFFNTNSKHNTAFCDTDSIVLDSTVKAMLLATRDADSQPSDFPEDIYMNEPGDVQAAQALIGPNKNHWLKSLNLEMAGVTAPGRAELVREFPKNVKVLPTKLVCKIKKNTAGTIDKFKMRCASRGDLDKTYYNEFDVFALTGAGLATFRLLMSLCILHGLMPYHYDVFQAFLQAPIPPDEQYYIRFPKQYINPEGFVGAKMLYALYGHRTSGKLWSETAHKFIVENFLDLKQSVYDECLYVGEVNNEIMMILIYVDDFVVACATELTRANFHDKLMSTFTSTYSGILNQFLQLKIEVETTTDSKGNTVPTKIDISNERSIMHLAEKFQIDTTKQPPRSPMTEGLNVATPLLETAQQTVGTREPTEQTDH
ncbi:hypothetical protein CYMTET_39794 [Cymbomonas tetramitiformis]|uniref:Reverse transcriptase Ty1/copia-type domain-containing protein n=1 Tax=Cymbomonas tetramitiformis TaxID=36881 RepID=A0AAE0CBK0_9CHLO|nr:hypothetical protein CYMTET_39794 [Cymbomonas tetramitiformis]